jgi:hypothetical protein
MITDDFIAVFEDVLDTEGCNELITYFEKSKILNLTYNRQKFNDGKKHDKDDETAFLLQPSLLPITVSNPIIGKFLDKFWPCYETYAEHYSVLAESEIHGILSMRLQKTLPGQGFHHWHYESSNQITSQRIIVWTLYLNDVEDGGETEFLYLRKRVSAKQGRVLICPAAFTHTHRGNPPLSNQKYILTGWLEFYGKP